ncbi:MAG TPA: hypothetical protein VF162_03370, partial [Streptosporangiaceae bacterium]
WWGSLWADRLTESSFGDRAVEVGLATRRDLDRLATAWLRWADSDAGWFLIPHGEIVCWQEAAKEATPATDGTAPA